ncbi:MAG: hypothetical protein KBF80_05920 [Flavobacteriales bacterium]|nr:hypothetical protein [Flavobacteriales bacterium]
MVIKRSKLSLRMAMLLFVGGGLIGIAVAWSIHTLRPPDLQAAPPMIAYFDEASVNEAGRPAPARAVRFYLATTDAGSLSAAMVAVDSARRHVPENGSTLFRRYKAMNGSRTTLDRLDEPTAQQVVVHATYKGSPTWSMDCPEPVLARMLVLHECNGIGLAVMRMADGTNTFQLIPVKISMGKARAVGTYEDRVLSEPCPNFCADPPELYLHRRN